MRRGLFAAASFRRANQRMNIDAYYIIIVLCLLVIMSYGYDILAKSIRVPSVLMLLGTGLLLQFAATEMNLSIPKLTKPLEVLGVVGLVMIVLEGALDLKIKREAFGVIRRSLLTALLLMLGSTLAIALIIYLYHDANFYDALVNALPMAVVSSAIAIPSVERLSQGKKQFITYEATFSDILGIMFFDVLVNTEAANLKAAGGFILKLLLIVLISILISIALVWLMDKIKSHIKFFLIFSVLILIYALSKKMHLSPLLMILVFGLFLNNIELLRNKPNSPVPFVFNIDAYLKSYRKFAAELDQLKKITLESAFLIRTFFFVLFGFTIDLNVLLDTEVIMVGTLITLVSVLIRYISLKFISETNIFPEVLVAPRGLITILLFYSIPDDFIFNKPFIEGIVLFVIIMSSVLMTVGIMLSRNKDGLDIHDPNVAH